MGSKRYELQFRHAYYGWVTAGNWPARTEAEGLRSLTALLKPSGAATTYRLAELVPREIKRGRSKEKVKYGQAAEGRLGKRHVRRKR